MKRIVLLAFFLTVPMLLASSALAREWTDNTGKHSVEAELVEIKGDQVILKKTTGSVITVPIARLSEADQQYLDSLDKPAPQPPDDAPDAPPAVIPQDEKLAAELSRGSFVSLRVSGQPLGSVLAEIDKATGNRIRILGQFGSDDDEILSKRVSLSLQNRPFWEAVDAVCEAAGVQFRAVKDGTLQLSTERSQFDKVKRVGTPVTVGAFRVYPGFDEFFDNAVLIIRAEPRFGEPQVRSYRAQITLPDGKQIQYKPPFIMNTSSILTGQLTLQIDPRLPDGVKKAQQIKLEARLAVASDPKQFTLPPLGQLVPKAVAIGNGTLYVTRAQLAANSPGQQMFEVELSARGLGFELEDAVLIDAAGNRVESLFSGGGKQDDQQDVTWNFIRAEISGDPGKCRLAFKVPGTGEKTIGPLADLIAKPAPAGATIVRVTKAGIDKQQGGSGYFDVAVEFDGFPASLGQVALVGPGFRPLIPRGWGGSGSMAQFSFDAPETRGGPDSYRLQLHAPTKVTEHVLQATFNDVLLAN